MTTLMRGWLAGSIALVAWGGFVLAFSDRCAEPNVRDFFVEAEPPPTTIPGFDRPCSHGDIWLAVNVGEKYFCTSTGKWEKLP